MLKVINGLIYCISNDGLAVSCTGRYVKKIVLTYNEGVITVSLQDYLGNPLPYEPVKIRITGESMEGEIFEPFEGICEDGIIDLSGYVAGDKLKIETLNANMENASLEVVL